MAGGCLQQGEQLIDLQADLRNGLAQLQQFFLIAAAAFFDKMVLYFVYKQFLFQVELLDQKQKGDVFTCEITSPIGGLQQLQLPEIPLPEFQHL